MKKILVIVDMQKDFINGSLGTKEAQEILPKIVEYINGLPDDTLCGKTDEDNLGFTYNVLDDLLLHKIHPNYETYKNIETRHKRNMHKLSHMPACPKFLIREENEEDGWAEF